MAPGRVGVTVVLNMHLGIPIETGLTRQEHEGVKKYFLHVRAAKENKIEKPKKKKIKKTKEKKIKKPKEKAKSEKRGFEAVELPGEYMEVVARERGSELKLLMGKMLTLTDISSGHGRVSMPRSQMWVKTEEDFLMPREADLVLGQGSKMEVRVFDPSMEEHRMVLSVWNGVCSLHHGWNLIVEAHQLQPATPIQIWSFQRPDASLCFILHKIRPQDVVPL